jgi:AcrR family transcriptional regulator
VSPKTKIQLEAIKVNRRKSILNAALIVFAEQGYHNASISKISTEAGISKGLMYNYFENKDALLKELLNTVTESMMKTMGIVGEQILTDKILTQHINTSFKVIQEDTAHWKLYFSVFTQVHIMAIAMEEIMPKIEPYMVSLCNYFEAKGEKDPMAKARYFCATIDGVQMQYMFDPQNFPIDSVKKMIIKQFVKQ